MLDWKFSFVFVALVFAYACTITHFNKSPDGSVDASNYSVGMDRKDMAVVSPNLSVVVGSSNGSDSLAEVKQGLLDLAESIK